MKLTALQKARTVVSVNFFILFIIATLTPRLVRGDFWVLGEETIEGMFLSLEFLAMVLIFRYYDQHSKKSEEDRLELEGQLKKKERELLGTLEYLGKVNVKISLVRSIIENTKAPGSRSELREIYSQLLSSVRSLAKRKKIFLKIVDLEEGKTISEQTETMKEEDSGKKQAFHFENKTLLEAYKSKQELIKNAEGKQFRVYYSRLENFSLKAFIIVPKNGQGDPTEDEKEFLQAIANQCEVVFLLFNSAYYKCKV